MLRSNSKQSGKSIQWNLNERAMPLYWHSQADYWKQFWKHKRYNLHYTNMHLIILLLLLPLLLGHIAFIECRDVVSCYWRSMVCVCEPSKWTNRWRCCVCVMDSVKRFLGQISPSPIDFHRRPYNTLALPCERVIGLGVSVLRMRDFAPLKWLGYFFVIVFHPLLMGHVIRRPIVE